MDFDFGYSNFRATGISLSNEGRLAVMTLNQHILICQVGRAQGLDSSQPSLDGVTIETDADGLFEEVTEVQELPSEMIID